MSSYPLEERSLTMGKEKEKSTCPVCNKDFNVSEIEAHVNRCLFLSSENKSEVKATPNKYVQKRGPEEIDSLWNSKKVREDKSNNIHSTPMRSSASNKSVRKTVISYLIVS